MRITALLSAAAIAALITINPVLAYGPSTEGPSFSYSSSIPQKAMSGPERGEMTVAFAIVKRTGIGPGYVLVKNDGGGAKEFRNCGSSEKCMTETIDVLLRDHVDSPVLTIPCRQVGGCVVVGR